MGYIFLKTAGWGWFAIGFASAFARNPVGLVVILLPVWGVLMFALAEQRQWIDTTGVPSLDRSHDKFSRLSAAATARRCRLEPAAGKTRQTRRQIYLREGGRCFWCNKRILYDEFHLDHVVPLFIGGPAVHRVENLVASCVRCNKHKGARDPIEWAKRNHPSRVPGAQSVISRIPNWPPGPKPDPDKGWTPNQIVLVGLALAVVVGFLRGIGVTSPNDSSLLLALTIGAGTAVFGKLTGIVERTA